MITQNTIQQDGIVLPKLNCSLPWSFIKKPIQKYIYDGNLLALVSLFFFPGHVHIVTNCFFQDVINEENREISDIWTLRNPEMYPKNKSMKILFQKFFEIICLGESGFHKFLEQKKLTLQHAKL